MEPLPGVAFEVQVPPNDQHISGETKLIADRVSHLGMHNGIVLSRYQGEHGPFVPVGEGLPFIRPDQMFAAATNLANSGRISLLSLSDRWPLQAFKGYEHDLHTFLDRFPASLVWEVGTMGFFDDLAKTEFHGHVIDRVDHFVAVSEMIRKEAIRNGVAKDRITTIFPPIDTELFSPVNKIERHDIRKRLDLPTNAPIGIYVGRFDSHKGIDFLLDAWGKTSNDPGYLLLLGSATQEEQPKYEELIAANPKIIYRGFIENDYLKAKYFKAADYLTFVSKSEGLSLMMMEAMATGLPQVVYSGAVYNSGIGELFIEGETGSAIDRFTGQALSQAVHQVLQKRAYMSVRSREELLKSATDLPTTVARFEFLYQKLIMGRERR